MKHFRILPATMLAMLVAMGGVQAQENEAMSLDELLQRVEQGSARDNQAEQQRLQQFRQAQAQQQQTLQNAINQRISEEQRSEALETSFEENELLIADVQVQLDTRLGSLRELFGVLQQVAGDARAQFQNSFTNVEYPDREQFLTDLAAKMGSSSQLASIEEIERLWFELQREATELGKVKRIPNYELVTTQGEISVEDIVRVGAFALVADGRYLQRNTETNTVSELQRQPEQGRFVNSTSALLNAAPGTFAGFGIDPT
ncbi:MAG: energy transducer TonB, partial [Gammaproteobacteria bacterium]|nr:energy transducer TonB [Gammaproteobacteria bacterium]